ncbi:TadE family type IV pilus minor pilin [Umezawaea beigongshangensis]|uniref:TadE family type IV pilus minor pilin n=1 Tax=Umezawaea beigongshangensis TaxID=2780383 RepID=UPI0018F12048|nr:TadE family type IV pilus minor pilin [Umezawaea beigongshangensis]
MRDDRGAVTVEAAVAVCGIVLFFTLAASGFGAVLDQLRCTDAAREAARLVARGEAGRAGPVVERIAPGAALRVHVHGDEVEVRVSAGPVSALLPGVAPAATAHAVLEPGAAP